MAAPASAGTNRVPCATSRGASSSGSGADGRKVEPTVLTPSAVTMEKVNSPSAGSSSATGRFTVCTAPSSRTLRRGR